MESKRKQALLVTYAIIEHFARTKVQMDLENELSEVMERLDKLEENEWGFYDSK